MNNIYNHLKLFLVFAILFFSSYIKTEAQNKDQFMNILEESMDEEFAKFSKNELPLYYMNYRVYDISGTELSSSMGTIVKSNQWKKRDFTITTRVGSYEFDNYHVTKETPPNASSKIMLPLENSGKTVIKSEIERLVKNAYMASQMDYSRKKTIVSMSADKDPLHDLTKETPSVYYEAPFTDKEIAINVKGWEDRLNRLSSIYKNYPDIFDGRVHLTINPIRKYFLSSENTNIIENELFIVVTISATTKDNDGNYVLLSKLWRPTSIDKLPSEEEIKAEILKLIDKQTQLKNAPYADPYSGPVLFSNQAAGVFFHEIFGHRVEAHRFKSDTDGQTFKSKLGEMVLPKDFSIYMDPTIKEYKGQSLFGGYQYDDEGIKGQRVTLIKDGKLNDFLYCRTPVNNHSKSNGHGRADIGNNAVARQSNLIVESSNLLSAKDIREAFIEELKVQGKEFGYYVDEVSGGLTMTGRMLPNSFNVYPIITYKVYVDGRPDEMVRGVNIIGTPLSVFANVIKAGEDKSEPFNGMCGAESGWLRVSAVSPMLLIKQVETQKGMVGNMKPFVIKRPIPENK